MSDRQDMELLAGFVPPCSWVPDLGCGGGRLLAPLRNRPE